MMCWSTFVRGIFCKNQHFSQRWPFLDVIFAQKWGQNGENSTFFKNWSSFIPFERKYYATQCLFKTSDVKINPQGVFNQNEYFID